MFTICSLVGLQRFILEPSEIESEWLEDTNAWIIIEDNSTWLNIEDTNTWLNIEDTNTWLITITTKLTLILSIKLEDCLIS
jgi:hypothetical protein